MSKLKQGVGPGFVADVAKRNDELARKHGATFVLEIPLIVMYTFPTPDQRNAFERAVQEAHREAK